MPSSSSAAIPTLNNLREIQNYNYPKPTPSATAPDFCLAAARFVSAKLVGLIQRSQHLNGFLASPEAQYSTIKRADLSRAWGNLATLTEFNEKVLPIAIKWGTKWGTSWQGKDVEFAHIWSDTAQADNLLSQHVPLVTGISLSDGRRDHFIVVVSGTGGAIWAVDSWGETGPESVVGVPKPFTFSKPARVSMNAGTALIPCSKPFFGFFRERGTRAPLKTVLAL